jgi:oxygen-independent coproporphyrinogen-3 oxidase
VTNGLRERIESGPYQAYAYAYPHKTAYRDLPKPVELHDLWDGEDRTALFGYVHIPFCTYRCGFCNLFALGQPASDLVEQYVEQLLRQIAIVSSVLGKHRLARFAIGGGTPSYLSAQQLARLFDSVTRHFTVDLHGVPAGIEVSPETATPDRLRVCREAGVDRVSMGVQSFVDAELKSLVRPTQHLQVVEAVRVIRELGFPTLNLDLIYGIPGQSMASLEASVRTALSFRPEELYLYPLYVRPGTGLGRRELRHEHSAHHDTRMPMYRAARDLLVESGYTQVSMRMFRSAWAPESSGPAYCCQNDGMVGIGCGARSYTRSLHYSDHYGVERASVTSILQRYVSTPESSFVQAHYGFLLDMTEQRRRYVIQSLLTYPGLDQAQYTARFGTPPLGDFPQLHELMAEGLAQCQGEVLALTAEGMAHADTIGPWLNSAEVVARMESHAVG